ncbi:MAG: hypothetical protein F2840_18405 [Actinobacteria bacterium]|nr:hypothetical protein [Actinomycetota bacterium]
MTPTAPGCGSAQLGGRGDQDDRGLCLRPPARPAARTIAHLSTGLGVKAAQAGHRVLFATATEWVT